MSLEVRSKGMKADFGRSTRKRLDGGAKLAGRVVVLALDASGLLRASEGEEALEMVSRIL